MKLLIAYILAATSLMADIVSFKWQPNTEPDLAGYVLYTGPAMGMPTQTHPTTETKITVAMRPHYFAWLAAVNTAGLESDPAGPLEYKPIAVLLTVESSRLDPGIPWVIHELFRTDETLFDPASANIRTKLSITRDNKLHVEFLDGGFFPVIFFITPTYPDELFRAFVSPNPI